MASSLQAGGSDAAAGAGVGAMVGGPYGAAIGGALGFLGGLAFGGSSNPTAPLFSDVNLATDNPTLYAQLQAQQNVVNQLQAAYTNRSQGMTAQEAQQYAQTMQNNGNALAHSGMAGTSMGMNQMNNASQNYQNDIAQRIMQQQIQLGQQLQGAQSGLTQATQGALQQTYGAAMVPYQQQIGQAGNQNQMYNGLFQGGLSMLGQGLNQNNLQALQGQSGGMLPGGYGMSPTGIQFQGGQSPYGGGYVAPGTSFGSMPVNVMPQQQPGGYSFNPSYSG